MSEEQDEMVETFSRYTLDFSLIRFGRSLAA